MTKYKNKLKYMLNLTKHIEKQSRLITTLRELLVGAKEWGKFSEDGLGMVLVIFSQQRVGIRY